VAATTPTFLGVSPPGGLDGARYAVLPVPYEGTVTYERGTAAAPAAIIRASGQVEHFDEELLTAFASAGVATLPPVEAADSPAEQMRRVKAAAEPLVAAGKFLLALGGEHSITAPLVEAFAAGGELSVLQLDAHADLRDSYDGTRHSHACVMRRVLECTGRICQVGVRSFSAEERAERPAEIARLITPAAIADDGEWIGRALERLGERVYVPGDMDVFDPWLAPGVGTPEPGGLSWREVTALLRRLCAEREVVGADIVEARPIPPNHVTEFVAARLACKIIAYTQQRRLRE
jgi:agmatinase